MVFTAPLTPAKPALTKTDSSGLRGCTPTYPHKIALISRTVKFAGFHKKRVRNSPAKSSRGSGPYAELISMKTSVGSLPVRGTSSEANPRWASEEWLTQICHAESWPAAHLELPDNVTSGPLSNRIQRRGCKGAWGLLQGVTTFENHQLRQAEERLSKFLEILLCLTLLQTWVIKQSKRKPKSQTKISL